MRCVGGALTYFSLSLSAGGVCAHVECNHVRHHASDVRHPGELPDRGRHRHSRETQGVHASRYADQDDVKGDLVGNLIIRPTWT